MKRCLQGFAVLGLAWTLGHPGICAAQDHSQSQDDSKYKLGVLISDSEVVGRPGTSRDLTTVRLRSLNANDPWSDAARNSLSSIWFHRLDNGVRAHLKLPKDRGLIVARVASNSPEHDMGIRENDILLTLGDVSLASPADLVGALKRLDDKSAPLVLLRNGETVTIPVQPRVQHGLSPVKTDQHVYVIGVMTSPVDPLLRAQLKLPKDRGLAVRDIDVKGPANKVKLAVGDILLELNGKPLNSEQTLFGLVQSNGEKPITLGIIHEGNEKSITLTPVQRKADTFQINFMSGHGIMSPGGPGHGPTFTYVRKMNSPAEKPANGQGNLIGTFSALPAVPLAVNPVTRQQIDLQLKAHDPKSPDPVAKRLDTMTAQIDTLRKAVDELAKAIKEKK